MNPNQASKNPSEFKMELNVECMFCDEVRKLMVPYLGYQQWLSGFKNIQDALPEIDPEDRELILSKMCDKCWDDFLPGKD